MKIDRLQMQEIYDTDEVHTPHQSVQAISDTITYYIPGIIVFLIITY